MIDKLIRKVIEDAKKEAEDTVLKAKEETGEKFRAEKEKIEREYDRKLAAAKERIDRESERKLSGFRMDKEKEILALQNSFIEEVLKIEEEKFREYLNRNMKNIIASLCRDTGKNNLVVRVPESAGEMTGMKDVKIERDRRLKDSFVIAAGKWKVVFDWERVRMTMEEDLRKKIGEYIFGLDNGQKRGD